MQIPCVVTMFCAPELRCTLFSQLYDPLVCALHLVFSYQYHHSHQVVSTYCEAAIAYKLNTFKLLVSLDSSDFQGQKKKNLLKIFIQRPTVFFSIYGKFIFFEFRSKVKTTKC